MSEHIHDGRSHCPACALEKIGRQKQEIADLEAEVARLQAELKTARACDSDALMVSEVDGYKALAERGAEGLTALSRRVHHREEHPWPFGECMRADCYDARAAIKPEEAKERR